MTTMIDSAAKRLKTSSSGPLLIGTHNGHFHADEALAVHMLRMLPPYQDAGLVRTRDPKVLGTCDIVVDVGGEYDAARHRYDHHQRGFTTTFPGRPTKLSSAGLVFMHFGRDIIAQRLGKAGGGGGGSREGEGSGEGDDGSDVGVLHQKMYQSFIEALDAHDNGISAYDPQRLAAAGIEKRFSDGGFSLGALVGRLNPNWNDPAPTDPAEAQRAEDGRFLAASRRIGEEFERDLDYYAGSWLPALDVVRTAFSKRREFDPQGRVLVFEGQSVPWKDHLYNLEAAEAEASKTENGSKVLYVLYPESPEPGAKWRVQCVPESKDSFVSRKPLPEAWRGFRDEELDRVSSIGGCVFVHAAGFIGGNKTFEGAKQMATKALES
jgi:uncharacterized UPF0160 family protein